MGSFFKATLQSFRAVAVIGLLACSAQGFANAGLISYTAGTGGTFDPSTPSTFTFTNFGQGTLSPGVDYTKVRVTARWNGTTPYPGAFDITSLSLSTPGTSTAFSNISFLAGTSANSLMSSGYVTLNSVVNTTNYSGVQLTLTIPTLTVNDGWNLDFRLGFADAPSDNVNTTAFQTVTAVNAAVPEINPATGGSALLLVAGVLAMVEQRRRKRAAAAVVAIA